MSITDQGADLARFALFEGFTESDLDALAAAMEHATFDEDRFIFQEGDQRGLLALIQEGSVAIEKQADSRVVRLATLSTGEALGEGVVLAADEPHGTSARTIEPTTLLFWNGLELRSLLLERPSLFAALVARAAAVVSRRLRAADAIPDVSR